MLPPPTPLKVDKIGQVQRAAAENIGAMQSNIDLVLERGEKIDLLVEKTEALDQNAFKFERSSRVSSLPMIKSPLSYSPLLFCGGLCWGGERAFHVCAPA